MMRFREAACVVALASLAAIAPVCAEPFESNPNLATSDADYAAGKQAMDRKNWPDAAKSFQIALKRNPDSADLHNYLGYTYRNQKNYDLAIRHYKRAIEIDPRHRGAHEYIGEAYLMMNDLPNAEKHLTALRGICLLRCEELEDLDKAVVAYKAKRG
ncbi:MAG: hypothetical protein JWN94_2962 [Betaproteobacteria bacterium]|nr:hypothetical protein [Betaproteobacteria bacterium]